MNSISTIDTSKAQLPAAYEAAKTALANCASIDECQDWADKAAALASYAKRANDETLERQAIRIRAHATRRCGELLKQFNTGPNGGRPTKNGDGTVNVSQKQAAEDAGLTERQRVTAVKIAGIPEEVFEQVVESYAPPSITKLADLGRPNRTSFTGENEWYTPTEYIELARRVLGTIQLDPASSDVAQRTIKAKSFFTETDDGLSREWNGKVWLNPPYAQPAISHFATKIITEVGAGRVTEAIMLTHNYTDTAWFQALARAATAICFTKGRIRFVSPSGEVAAPTQGQAFFYFGARFQTFLAHFREVGFVVEVRQ